MARVVIFLSLFSDYLLPKLRYMAAYIDRVKGQTLAFSTTLKLVVVCIVFVPSCHVMLHPRPFACFDICWVSYKRLYLTGRVDCLVVLCVFTAFDGGVDEFTLDFKRPQKGT